MIPPSLDRLPSRTPKLRKWYFCANERGFPHGIRQIAAAVASARANTDLEPHCLYAGSKASHVQAIEGLGVRVRQHRPTFDAELRAAYGDAYDTFVGHWLRVDIPRLETGNELILYTDYDVLFLGPPRVPWRVPLLAAAPEVDPEETLLFNSGVLVMNTKGLRRVQDAFLDAIRARLSGDFRYPGHDQVSFNTFFRRTFANRLRGRARTALPLVSNWKPYWGWNDDARIVHFHGPKPMNIRDFEAGRMTENQAKLVALWDRDRAAYARYVSEWERYDREGAAMLA
ncbi:MAG: hypothetical protein AAF919_19240 [Pseudomonadota bacterium]